MLNVQPHLSTVDKESEINKDDLSDKISEANKFLHLDIGSEHNNLKIKSFTDMGEKFHTLH